MLIEKKDGPGKKILDRILKEVGNKVAKVGWFSSARYENGTPVAYVATIHEYGSTQKNIPPRPILRPTISKKQGDWRTLAEQLGESIIKGNESVDGALNKIGLKAAGDIRQTITEITTPALEESTIKARLRKRKDKKTMGFLSKPLIDTGIMLNTVTHVVEDEEK